MAIFQTTPADEARAIVASISDPVAAAARLYSVLGHDRTSDVVSPSDRAEFESTFADELILKVMALGIRVGDEVYIARDFDQVSPAPTNIDAHYIVEAIDGARAKIRRVSRPNQMLRSAPLLALVRTGTSTGHTICDGHRLDREPPVQTEPESDIDGYFGLSYCSHLVLPRVLLQSMPAEWQRQFVALVGEMEAAFAHVEKPSFYDVRAAVEMEAGELSEAERARAGVTFDAGEDGEPDQWHDRDFNEIEPWTRVLVPVADPLPSYNRGRTRVPRIGDGD